jgi:hypothetical protein
MLVSVWKERWLIQKGSDARELVAELEFVWNQIKSNSISSSGSSPGRRQFAQPLSGGDGPMRVLSPMSQDDEEEIRSQQKSHANDEYKDNTEYTDSDKKGKNWRMTVENALVKMTAEIAALREQISTGREYQGRKRRSIGRWIAWLIWIAIRHIVTDLVLLGILLYWLRKKKDRRIEDSVRAALRVVREYVRKLLPPR